MKKNNAKTSFFSRYYAQILLAIIAFTFFSRMYNLHKPEKYVFDEVYHAVTAKLILHEDTRAYEWNNPPPEPNTAVDWLHPPLAKYTQALSMGAFGETSFGWRFSSVIFGCIVVLLSAKIALALFDSHGIALLSALLTATDGLVFTMSRIAMNDIHVTTFILLAIYCYILFFKSKYSQQKYLLFAGISGGLAIGTKWSGLFVLLGLGILEAVRILKPTLNSIYNRSFKSSLLKKMLLKIAFSLLAIIVIPSILYILSYSQMFLIGKDFNHLIELHKNIWWYQTSLDATHPAQSVPFEWFFNLKPVWISVEYVNQSVRGDIYAIGNPALFIIGNITVFISTILLASRAFTKKFIVKYLNKSNLSAFVLLFFFYSIVWLPWQLSPRIMFFYHYLPAVPLLSILISFWLYKMYTKNLKEFSVAIVIFIVTTFIIWYPHLTLIPVHTDIKDSVYFYFENWNQAVRDTIK